MRGNKVLIDSTQEMKLKNVMKTIYRYCKLKFAIGGRISN